MHNDIPLFLGFGVNCYISFPRYFLVNSPMFFLRYFSVDFIQGLLYQDGSVWNSSNWMMFGCLRYFRVDFLIQRLLDEDDSVWYSSNWRMSGSYL